MKRQVSDVPDKPVFDETAFQQLLSAAYVLQQHKERQQELGKDSESAFSKILNQVLEIQEQIRHHQLDLQAATTLVAKRVREFTGAGGAAVGILEKDDLEYYAATGSAAGELGSRAPASLSLSSECLESGDVLRVADTEQDSRVHPDLCRPLGIRALITAPIVFEGTVRGVLEIHFAQPNSFKDEDVRICQLLASLLSEAVGKERELSLPPAPNFEPEEEAEAPSDQAAMLAALEKIKPQLRRLAGATSAPLHAPSSISSPANGSARDGDTNKNAVCESCGHPLDGNSNEPFCSECGAPRRTAKTWSSLWDLQRAAEKAGTPKSEPEENPAHQSLDILPSELEDIVAQFSIDGDQAAPSRRELPPLTPFETPAPARSNGNGSGAYAARPETSQTFLSATSEPYTANDSIFPEDAGLAGQHASADRGMTSGATDPGLAPTSPWTSAAKAKEWFETEHRESWLLGKWRRQRANVYLAVAAGVLITVLFGFESPSTPVSPLASNTSNRKAAAHKAPPAPELSVGDKILVGLGLAEAPEAPAYKGNPEVKVWVDVHTALYHCPGAGLYGKTPGGRFTTQGDAQQDNFQPASRRACE